ncbi:MAG: TlpA family protein disulfide reductase [Candidatus Yanofskybacteria bacterium]|nr:TlpA family protein disulfide reductase [Candidatus Yanofskybacteria bacterium]
MSNKTLGIGAVVLVVALLVFSRLYSGGLPATQTHVSLQTQAPDFSLSKLGGGTITLAEYKGKKPVIVDFWASWCPNCRRDIPRLNGFYQKYKDQIEVIGINLQEDPSTVENFVSSQGVFFPIALDPDGQASRAYAVQYTNYHVLIDRNGNIVRVIPGDISESDFQSLASLN